MIERLAYLIKTHLPGVFPVIAYVGQWMTVLRFSRRRAEALAEASIQGAVAGQHAVMRPLGLDDLDELQGFIEAMPASHLAYFHPHGFGRADLTALLRSRSFMTYGLFVEDALAAYALLKLAPTGSAFIGLLVGPEHTGKGIGRFIVEYLYWQASLAGLRTRSTISRHNGASLRSHQAVADFAVIAELPNDYLMIEFPRVQPDRPVLGL